MTDTLATLGFRADTADLDKASSKLNNLGKASQDAERKITASTDGMSNSFKSSTAALTALQTAIGALGVALSVRGLVEYTNTWADLNSRLLNATKDANLAKEALDSITQTARRTYSSLTDTADAFLRNSTTLTELGYSTQQQLLLSEALNNALVISGTKGQAAASVMGALSKSFANGQLRGDEFNSVIENGGRIAEALAAGLGVTTLQLRAMSQEGLLTTSVVFEALTSQAGQLALEADGMAATIGDGMLIIGNAVQSVVGRFDQLAGASGGVAESLTAIGDGIAGLDDTSLMALADTLELVATIAGVVVVGAMGKKAVATATATAADFAAAKQKLLTAQASQAQAAAELALMRIQQQSLAAQVVLAQSERTKTAIRAQLTANTTALIAAERAHTATLAAVSGAQAGASVTATALGAAWRFMLGPLGLVITALGVAATAFIGYRDAAKEAEAETEELTKKWERMSNAAKGSFAVEIQTQIIELSKLRQEAEKARNNLDGSLESLGEFGKYTTDIANYEKQIAELNKKLEVMNELFAKGLPDKSNMKNVAEDANDLTVAVSGTKSAYESSQDALEKMTKSLAAQTLQLTMSREDFELWALQIEAANNGVLPEHVKELITMMKGYQAVRAEQERMANASKALDGIMDGGLFGFGDVDTSELDSLIDRVNDFGGAWNAAGSAMIGAFGGIADALGDYSKRMTELISQQDELNAKKLEYAGNAQETAKIDAALAKNQNDIMLANLNGMSRAAGAAASLFKEQSKERKALHNAEKVFATIEIALALQKASANAMTAISAAFTAPPPLGFAMGAAMIGIMSGLGLFSGSSGSAPVTNDGTGTSLGSDDASNSISASADEYKDIALDQLVELRKIRDSMQGLTNGIAQLAKSLIVGGQLGGAGVTGLGTERQFQISSGGFGSLGLVSSLLTGGALGGTLSLVDKLTGGVLSGIYNSIIGGISKTTKKLLDSGIQFDSQDLGDVLADGFEGYYFNVIETTKRKLWGLSKKTETSTETEALEGGILTQIGAIFGFLADAVSSAVDVLGVDMVKTLESFNIELGSISFEGLSGEEIQKKLEQVISAQGDLMAEYVLPQIKQYQQIGEGALETLLRVAKEQAVFNDALDMIGQNLGDLSNLMRIDVAQSIITMMGGLEAFNDAVGVYFKEFFSETEQLDYLTKSLTEAMSGLGYQLPATREGFRALVDGLDLTTEAGQAAFAALMELVPGMAEYFKQIEKQTGAFTNFEGAAKGAFEMLKRSVQVEKDRAQEALNAARDVYNAEVDRINGVKRAIEQVYETLQNNLSVATDALMLSRDAEIERINTLVAGAVAIRDAEVERLNAVKDAIQQQYASLEANASTAHDALLRSRDAEIARVREGLNGAALLRDAELNRISALRDAINAQFAELQASLGSAGALLNRSLAAESQRIESQYSALVQLSGAAEQALQSAFSAERDAIQGAASIRLTALNEEARLARSVAADMLRLQQQFAANNITLEQALAAARRGDFTLAQRLNVAQVDSGQFSSASDFAAAQALQTFRLNEIAKLAEGQKTEAERMAEALESQVELIQQQADAQLAALDAQLNAALGIDASVLSIADALAQYQAAQQAIADFDVDAQREQLAEQQKIADALLGVDNSVVSVADALNQYRDAQLALDEFNHSEQIAALDLLVASANNAYQQAEQLANAQIDAINAQVDAVMGVDNSVLGLSAAIGKYNAAQAALSSFNLEQQLAYAGAQIAIADMQLQQAQDAAAEQISALNAQVDTLLGIDNTVLSLADAINGYQSAKLALDEFAYDAQIEKLDLQLVAADALLSQAEKAYADEIARLDAILSNNENELNALLGIDNSIKSLDSAMRDFYLSIVDLAASMRPAVTPVDKGKVDDPDYVDVWITKMQPALESIARSTTRTSDILQRIEFDGIDTRPAEAVR